MAATLKAKVQNGRLILDEPTGLPEGTVVELVEASRDPFAKISDEAREELNASIDRGTAQAREGTVQTVDDYLSSQ